MTDINLFGASPFDAIRRIDEAGEYWSARELMPLLGYDRWENFAEAIERARISIANSDQEPNQNASWHREPSGKTTRVNYRLSRYGAYVTAMCGDVRKPEIASAQAYFAVRTRQAEVAIPDQQAVALPSRRELAAWVVEAEDRADAAEAQVKALQPKADYVDGFVGATTDATLLRVLANQLGVKESDLRDLLVQRKVIYRKLEGSRYSRSKGRQIPEYSWHSYSDYSSWFVERDQPEAPRLHNGQMRTTLYVTPVGKVKVADLIAKAGAA